MARAVVAVRAMRRVDRNFMVMVVMMDVGKFGLIGGCDVCVWSWDRIWDENFERRDGVLERRTRNIGGLYRGFSLKFSFLLSK